MTFKLKNTARTNIFNVVIFKLNIITNGGSKAVKKRHDKNYQNLEKNWLSSTNDVSNIVKRTVQKFSRKTNCGFIWTRTTHSD